MQKEGKLGWCGQILYPGSLGLRSRIQSTQAGGFPCILSAQPWDLTDTFRSCVFEDVAAPWVAPPCCLTTIKPTECPGKAQGREAPGPVLALPPDVRQGTRPGGVSPKERTSDPPRQRVCSAPFVEHECHGHSSVTIFLGERGLGEGVIIKSDLVKIQNPLVICKKTYCMEKLLDPGPILYNSLRSVLWIFLTSHPKREANRQTCALQGPSPLKLIWQLFGAGWEEMCSLEAHGKLPTGEKTRSWPNRDKSHVPTWESLLIPLEVDDIYAPLVGLVHCLVWAL